MKKYRAYVIWGKIKQASAPLIKLTACSTRKAAESFIRRNDAIYREMQIREVIA